MHVGFYLVESGACDAAQTSISTVKRFGDPTHGEDMLDVNLVTFFGTKWLAAVEGVSAIAI